MSTSPPGPPPSGPPAGPPPGPPGPPPGPAGPPSTGGAPPAQPGDSFTLNRNQIIGIGVVIALIIGVLIGVLAGGGGGDDKASGNGGGTEEQTIELEPISSIGDAPFTPPLAPQTKTPTTLAPPPAGQGPFGGTGDNTLCDREALITFLTASGNAQQAREWARVVGIPVGDIATYIRDLIPTVLSSDTRVTNHTFKNGRAIPLQSVLQAGTAVLVDQYGKLVARCRCGNPLLDPTKVRDPVYTGPKWPGFDPTIIVIIVPKGEPVFPKGGVLEATTWTINLRAEATNLRGTRDSTTVVEWGGTFNVASSGAFTYGTPKQITGNGNGTLNFDGGCYADGGTGALIAPVHTAAAFDVGIEGTASGTIPNRTYSLTLFGINWATTQTGSVPNEPNCGASSDPQGFIDGSTELFTTVDVPAKDGPTQLNLGEYSVTITLAAAGTDNL